MSMKVRLLKNGSIVEYENTYAMRLIEQRKAVWVSGDEPVTPEQQIPDYLEICKKVDALEAAMGSAGLVDIHAVRYTEQMLLRSQQAQARANISAADAADVQALIADINALHPLTITAFSVSPSLAEKGSTVRAQSFAYSVNRAGAAVTLEGAAVSGGTASRADVLTEDRSYVLRAVLGDAMQEKTVRLSFVAPLYYGVGADCTPESATVLALTRVLSTSRARSFTVSAGDGQYILFALPVALGAPTFKVGGFEGGFELQGEFDFTNASGHTEAYRLYRSTNAGLGSTTVSVS